jgi:two-component system, chemotaxis family, chemotaxis protein CheY
MTMDGTSRILIVDDFATMRKIVSNYLNKLGYKDITESDSAVTAWDLLQKEHFDLVISDYNIPEMNGLELLTKIRGDTRLKEQKFIMLTAETDQEILVNTKKLRINGYILKPFKIDVLEAKLKSVFGEA